MLTRELAILVNSGSLLLGPATVLHIYYYITLVVPFFDILMSFDNLLK